MMFKGFEKIIENVSKINEDGSLTLYNMILDSLKNENTTYIDLQRLLEILAYNSPYAKLGYNKTRQIKGIYLRGIFLYLDNKVLKLKVLSDPKGTLLNGGQGCFDTTDPTVYPEHPDKHYFLEEIPEKLMSKVYEGIYDICLHMIEYGNILIKKQEELTKEMEEIAKLNMLSKEERVLKNWGVNL
ncbi:MAG TPA: hypothetical protein VGB37_05155 [Candidatus Lokiarchaeia archaeon]